MTNTDSSQSPAITHAPQLREMTYAEFFKSRTALVKAFCAAAKSYIQISSAALALPILFAKAWFGEHSRAGFNALGVPWSLLAAWASFLLAIAFGLAYQWLVVRRLWNKLHRDNLTPGNAGDWGVAQSVFVPKLEWLDRSYLYGGMVIFFYLGACFFVLFIRSLLAVN
jgi:hypothetical protein